MPKITENANITKNQEKCKKSWKMPEINENVKNYGKCQKSRKTMENAKLTENAKITDNLPKITKNTKNHRKCQKSRRLFRYLRGSCGLTAPRRTKSGPKGPPTRLLFDIKI